MGVENLAEEGRICFPRYNCSGDVGSMTICNRVTGGGESHLETYATETLAAESPRENTPGSLSNLIGVTGETATGEQHIMEPIFMFDSFFPVAKQE